MAAIARCRKRPRRCANEFAALDAFCDRVEALDPDVITGWNTIDFDLTVLQRIAARVRHPFDLGRDAGAIRLRKAEGYFGSGQATIPGRSCSMASICCAAPSCAWRTTRSTPWRAQVLGEGKAVKGDVRDRIAEILHNYRHDLPAFALYARTDARLAYQIVQKLDLVRLAFARSQLDGHDAGSRRGEHRVVRLSVSLSELEKRGIVAPSVRGDDSRVHAAQQGGHVLEPVAGLHRNVWVFDFKSLYPSVIRTFNIDPLSYVADAAGRMQT